MKGNDFDKMLLDGILMTHFNDSSIKNAIKSINHRNLRIFRRIIWMIDGLTIDHFGQIQFLSFVKISFTVKISVLGQNFDLGQNLGFGQNFDFVEFFVSIWNRFSKWCDSVGLNRSSDWPRRLSNQTSNHQIWACPGTDLRP